MGLDQSLEMLIAKLKDIENKDFATQDTLLGLLSKLDIALSALRDALRSGSDKDFTTLEDYVEAAKLSVDNCNLLSSY